MTNTFHLWADMVRTLRDRLLVEIGLDAHGLIDNPRAGELLGALNGLINDCEQTARVVGDIEFHDRQISQALARAVQRTGEELKGEG